MFRLGNERGNEIIDAQVRVVLFRTEHTAEGKTLYRMIDLKLTRERAISLSRSWNIFHTIDKDSPLYGQTPEQFLEQETEIHLMVIGIDDTTKQTIHAKYSYYPSQVQWGARFADVLKEVEPGVLELDLRKFQALEATEPTEDFPYPKGR
jgi:inward rectifier potassium channel